MCSEPFIENHHTLQRWRRLMQELIKMTNKIICPISRHILNMLISLLVFEMVKEECRISNVLGSLSVNMPGKKCNHLLF